jgi:hypothetical protein
LIAPLRLTALTFIPPTRSATMSSILKNPEFMRFALQTASGIIMLLSTYFMFKKLLLPETTTKDRGAVKRLLAKLKVRLFRLNMITIRFTFEGQHYSFFWNFSHVFGTIFSFVCLPAAFIAEWSGAHFVRGNGCFSTC